MARGNPREIAGVREGQILANKYRVEKVLGIGGMGAVVAAHHLQLDTKVALKFLLPATLEHPEAVGRFAREARAAVRITSEHVARVFDVGTLESGAPYMVMEFLEGVDLGSRLRQRGPFPVEQAVEFVLQACVAVACAHSLGIVHRDLKPANLFCLRRGDGAFLIKVLDFGISKTAQLSAHDAGSSVTHASAVMGSPQYMSPEQMHASRDVDAQSDIWAMGVTLYELLTGLPPFTGDSFAEIAIRVATAPFVPARHLRPDLPAGIEGVIARCLAKEKKLRFADVAELAQALLDFGPPRSRALVDQIVGILRSAGFAAATQVQAPGSRSGVPAPPAGLAALDASTVLPDPSRLDAFGTMAPSATTAAGGRRARSTPARSDGMSRVALAAVGGGVSALALAAGVGALVWSMRAPHPASSPGAPPSPMVAAGAVGSLEVRPLEPVAASSIPALPLPTAAAPTTSASVDVKGAPKRAPALARTTSAPLPATPPPPDAPPVVAAARPPDSPDDSDPLSKLKPK